MTKKTKEHRWMLVISLRNIMVSQVIGQLSNFASQRCDDLFSN